ncbi:MAG: CHAT domain-containing protein [Thermoanaerobaculia bacterium]
MLAACRRAPEGEPYTPEHRRLLESVVVGRQPMLLAGPWRRSAQAGPAEQARLDRAVRSLALPPGAARSAPALGAWASALVAQERVALGVAVAEEAFFAAPQDARLANDLGVARWLEAVRGQPELRLPALESLLQALALDSELLPARHNAAVALEDLGLTQAANPLWQGLAEESEPWASEAREALARAPSPPRAVPPPLSPSGEAGSLESDVTARWAEAVARGDGVAAGQALAEGLRRAAALAAGSGDRLDLEGFEGLARLAGRPGAQSRAAEALLGLVHGHHARKVKDDCAEAERLLSPAEAELRSLGHPWHLLARFERLCCQGRAATEEPRVQVAALAASLAGRPYWILRSRVLWELALLEAGRGRPQQALLLRERVAAQYRAAREVGLAATVDSMRADNLEQLGRSAEAWALRFAVLPDLAGPGLGDRRSLFWASVAEQALAEGLPRVALAFAREAGHEAEALGDASLAADATALDAEARARLGEAAGLREELEAARARLAEQGDDASRSYPESQLALAEARFLPREEAPAALAAASRALELLEAREQVLGRAGVLAERARLRRELQDNAGARADLEAALADLEAGRAQLEHPEDRRLFFEQARRVFDQLAELAEAEGQAPAALLTLLGRGRGRSVEEVLAPGEGQPLDLGALAPGEVLLFFHYLPTELLVLRGSAGGWQAFHLARPPEAALWRFAGLVQDGHQPEAREALGRRLYAQLLAPALPKEGVSSLVLVPDGPLAALPWAALSGEDGRFLIERSSLRLAPSVRLALGRKPPWVPAESSLLALGDPAFDPAAFPGVPRLPEAQEEAEEVAHGFRRGRVLLGEAATEAAFRELAGGAEVVHFAGHARANARSPELSSLLLAPGAGEDGTLEAQELESLSLARTRLVYLAACESARGPLSHLEGALSLARELLARGAHQVVASLWTVDSQGSAELAKSFYRHLAQGESPEEALAQSQREALASPNETLADPSLWAAYQITGGASRSSREGALP